MKKIITVLCILINSFIQAQSFDEDTIITFEDTIIMVEDPFVKINLDEEYLIELLQNAQLVYCKIDQVDDLMSVKNMFVVFNTDTMIYRAAFIESCIYRSTILAPYYAVWCSYMQLDDAYGNTYKFAYEIPAVGIELESDEQSLNEYKFLIPVLDSLIQKTDIIDYSKDTRIFLDIDN